MGFNVSPSYFRSNTSKGVAFHNIKTTTTNPWVRSGPCSSECLDERLLRMEELELERRLSSKGHLLPLKTVNNRVLCLHSRHTAQSPVTPGPGHQMPPLTFVHIVYMHTPIHVHTNTNKTNLFIKQTGKSRRVWASAPRTTVTSTETLPQSRVASQ